MAAIPHQSHHFTHIRRMMLQSIRTCSTVSVDKLQKGQSIEAGAMPLEAMAEKDGNLLFAALQTQMLTFIGTQLFQQ